MSTPKKIMSFFPWQGRVALIFFVFAVAFNCLHYAIFSDSIYIFKFILAQLGFLPISVYLVTVVINQLLGRREKIVLLKKLNMVIGSFFSEVGTDLLRHFIQLKSDKHTIFKHLQMNVDWQRRDYHQALKKLKELEPSIKHTEIDLEDLRSFLTSQKAFLLSLLGNSNLLEHESFTELLWAVFHLSEELCHRKDLATLSTKDYEHLTGDIKRVYIHLVSEWLAYMAHLQTDYPFLFSLAVRTNPFNPMAQVEIE